MDENGVLSDVNGIKDIHANNADTHATKVMMLKIPFTTCKHSILRLTCQFLT